MPVMTKRIDVEAIKAGVSLPALIAESLLLRREGQLMVGLCPFHGERTPSFTVFADHYHCFGCGAHGDVFMWLEHARRMKFSEALAYLGDVDRHPPVAPLAALPPKWADPARNSDLARRLWVEAVDPAETPVEVYLRHRGIRLPDVPAIRFHPACPRGAERLPAMLAQMTCPATGEPIGIHRTFLSPDGSAKAAGKAKMMLGTAGVIRLSELTGRSLGLAEGVESALTAIQVVGWKPVWAAGSSGGIKRFPPRPGHSLVIFADGDEVGLTSARQCAARWVAVGAEVRIHIPPPGKDWNDIAQRSSM
jgi:hypothetical protein